MAAGANRSPYLSHPRNVTVAVLGCDLAGVDEVLQLLFVLVRVAIGRVAQDAALLSEVLERRASVACGTEAKLARGFGRRQRASPAQQVEELRRQERDACFADRKCGELETYGREQWSVQLPGGIEELGQRLRTRRGDVVRAGRSALGRQDHRLDAVVSVDELQRGIVACDRRHPLEVEVPGERLRFVGVQAVGESEGQDVDVGVSQPKVADVRLDLHDVAYELMA